MDRRSFAWRHEKGRRDFSAGLCLLLDAVRSGFLDLIFHPIALAFDGDGFGVVQQSIQHGGGQGGIVVEDLGPVLIRLVGSDDGRAVFIALAEDLEEQISTGFVDG